MKCPSCFALDSTVLETRSEDGLIIRRRRKCDECGHKFTTYEIPPGAYTMVRSFISRWKARGAGAYAVKQRRLQFLLKFMKEDQAAGLSTRQIHAKYSHSGVSLRTVQRHLREAASHDPTA
jgi:hypothetical protein